MAKLEGPLGEARAKMRDKGLTCSWVELWPAAIRAPPGLQAEDQAAAAQHRHGGGEAPWLDLLSAVQRLINGAIYSHV